MYRCILPPAPCTRLHPAFQAPSISNASFPLNALFSHHAQYYRSMSLLEVGWNCRSYMLACLSSKSAFVGTEQLQRRLRYSRSNGIPGMGQGTKAIGHIHVCHRSADRFTIITSSYEVYMWHVISPVCICLLEDDKQT
jgi:hypothetical protein